MTCLRACPTALDSIAAAVEQLGADAAWVRPVFVDIDPERARRSRPPSEASV
jgi:cytochrome oxidase Cu insertion factor (SCO1/SenC/PrrC family)